MPDKPGTVAAYAAGASLAAVTLFYVFGPTFFIDSENSSNTATGRRRGIVGLSNPANDCFINSVLQALAGLGELRLYLIRELHRKELDGDEVYSRVPEEQDGQRTIKREKVRLLQQGLITRAVKDMLDALNERPIVRKTITARPFIEALERAYRTRISRNQQDAQEFLQVVAERLCDEYHAAVDARKRALKEHKDASGKSECDDKEGKESNHEDGPKKPEISLNEASQRGEPEKETLSPITEDEFPLEGKLESQIQCQFCQFRNRASVSNFVTLTLNVPQKSSTSLDHCFDILLKTESIDDFKCDKCRLIHALKVKNKELAKAQSDEMVSQAEADIFRIERALQEDPEKVPEGVRLPPLDQAPKRNIKRYMRITSFPRLLAIHLSRSIYDPRNVSLKNAAKVSFPERLRLGGILDERWYKLLGIVCHKGNHNSGHYESFRRNFVYPPFATPDAFGAYAASQSRRGSKVTSPSPSPRLPALTKISEEESRPSTGSAASPVLSVDSASSNSVSSPPPSRPSSKHVQPSEMFSLRESVSDQNQTSGEGFKRRSESSVPRSSLSNAKSELSERSRFLRKRKANDRWWRISDEKVKECKTSDVLSMQKEVYLLFYELEKPGDEPSKPHQS